MISLSASLRCDLICYLVISSLSKVWCFLLYTFLASRCWFHLFSRFSPLAVFDVETKRWLDSHAHVLVDYDVDYLMKHLRHFFYSLLPWPLAAISVYIPGVSCTIYIVACHHFPPNLVTLTVTLYLSSNDSYSCRCDETLIPFHSTLKNRPTVSCEDQKTSSWVRCLLTISLLLSNLSSLAVKVITITIEQGIVISAMY